MRLYRAIPAAAALSMWLAAWCGSIEATTLAKGDVGACQPGDQSSPHAELFATNNTATITDPGSIAGSQLHDGLQLFEMQATTTIARHGAAVAGSTLVDGVSWSKELQQNTYERSREFHLCGVDQPTLHALAEALRRQFNQKSVLTFGYLPQNAPEANAVTIDVPGIDIARFGDALAADAAAHNRLPGGSVTTTDHTLILIAGSDDLGIARRLIDAAGGSWNAATIAYGKREVVGS